MKSSMLVTQSWCGWAGSKMGEFYNPLHFLDHLLNRSFCTCSIMIFYSYETYAGFLQHTDFDSLVSIPNSWPKIVQQAPSLQNQSQCLSIIFIISFLFGSSTFFPVFIFFSNLAVSLLLINYIKSFCLEYSQERSGKTTQLPTYA